MEYRITKYNKNTAAIKLVGRLDANAAERFKSNLKALTTGGLTDLVIDMEAVSFIDSSGSSALVSGFEAVRNRGGSLVLANVGPQLKVALEMTHLNRIFPICNDVASALASF